LAVVRVLAAPGAGICDARPARQLDLPKRVCGAECAQVRSLSPVVTFMTTEHLVLQTARSAGMLLADVRHAG